MQGLISPFSFMKALIEIINERIAGFFNIKNAQENTFFKIRWYLHDKD